MFYKLKLSHDSLLTTVWKSGCMWYTIN